jgi:hypothetical protein
MSMLADLPEDVCAFIPIERFGLPESHGRTELKVLDGCELWSVIVELHLFGCKGEWGDYSPVRIIPPTGRPRSTQSNVETAGLDIIRIRGTGPSGT